MARNRPTTEGPGGREPTGPEARTAPGAPPTTGTRPTTEAHPANKTRTTPRTPLPGSGLAKLGVAVAVLAAAGLLLAGCNAAGQGVRTEGTGNSTPIRKTPTSASPSASPSVAYKKVNAVDLLKKDPKVGAEVKKSLAKPCAADAYPIEVTYAPLTGGKTADVIVNVMTCADSVGIGSYVYRRNGDTYENVFTMEQPSVYAGVNKGELEVSKQTYDTGDKVCCPSGEDVMPYRWKNGRFVAYAPYHTDYSKTAVESPTPEPAETGEPGETEDGAEPEG
ncbi:hypothetical protein [Streptomyces sp. NPDC003077]|uniref:hypothetical protein n=1 Tax=Streptomyces sp. NPDC003077 TaxID=3154443 RepID=UPI0033A2FC78